MTSGRHRQRHPKLRPGRLGLDRDEARGIELARRVRTGTIGVNYYRIDRGAPFGGVKDSGIGANTR